MSSLCLNQPTSCPISMNSTALSQSQKCSLFPTFSTTEIWHPYYVLLNPILFILTATPLAQALIFHIYLISVTCSSLFPVLLQCFSHQSKVLNFERETKTSSMASTAHKIKFTFSGHHSMAPFRCTFPVYLSSYICYFSTLWSTLQLF